MTDHPDNTAEQAAMTNQADRAGGDGLALCPCCNAESKIDAAFVGSIYEGFHVICTNAKCGCQSGIFPTGPMAKRVWNTRTAPPSGNAGEGAGDIDALAEIWGVCDRASYYSKSKLAGAIARIVEARTKARAAAPPQPAPAVMREKFKYDQPAPDAVREALEIARKVQRDAKLLSEGRTDADPEKLRWLHHSYGADEVAYKIEAALSSAPVPSGEGTISEIIRELRDEYPAVDVTTAVFADLAGVPCCVIPQDRVLAIIGALERFAGRVGRLPQSQQSPERAADGNTFRYHATGLPAGGDAIAPAECKSP